MRKDKKKHLNFLLIIKIFFSQKMWKRNFIWCSHKKSTSFSDWSASNVIREADFKQLNNAQRLISNVVSIVLNLKIAAIDFLGSFSNSIIALSSLKYIWNAQSFCFFKLAFLAVSPFSKYLILKSSRIFQHFRPRIGRFERRNIWST